MDKKLSSTSQSLKEESKSAYQSTQPSTEKRAQDTPSKTIYTLPKAWQHVVTRYKLANVVGRGATGVVVKARNRQTKEKVAIKHINIQYETDYTYKKILREISILRQLSEMKENVHTVKISDIIVLPDYKDIFIVMNYVENDLSYLLQQQDLGFSEEHTLLILFKMLCAMNFIHKANIIHRDIKPGNFLIDDNFDLFLCDFGLARTLPKVETRKKDYSREELSKKLTDMNDSKVKSKRHLSNHVVTRYYRPPEIILQEKKYQSTVDMWSVGCILTEVINLEENYDRQLKVANNGPIFKGKFCFPMSPISKKNFKDDKDQLELILETLGKIDDTDMSFISHPELRDYTESMQADKPVCKIQKIFNGSSKGLVEVLLNMLEFNPYFRKKPQELLQMKIFDDHRNEFPDWLKPPSKIIQLDVDKRGVFDYSTSKFTNMSIDDLKLEIAKEVEFIKKLG